MWKHTTCLLQEVVVLNFQQLHWRKHMLLLWWCILLTPPIPITEKKMSVVGGTRSAFNDFSSSENKTHLSLLHHTCIKILMWLSSMPLQFFQHVDHSGHDLPPQKFTVSSEGPVKDKHDRCGWCWRFFVQYPTIQSQSSKWFLVSI